MANEFRQYAKEGDPSPAFFAVTPSDTVNFTTEARALYVGVTGDVVAVGLDGVAVTFKAAPVGVLPIRCKRVDSTNTTATDIVGLI